MKKILPVLFFVCLAFQGFAQFDEVEAADSLKKIIIKRTQLGKIAITLGGGLSWRVAQLPEEVNSIEKAFYKDLLSGNSIDATAMYYFNKRLGFGLRYNSFLTTALLEDIIVTFDTSSGGSVNVYGSLKEQTQVSFYGGTFGGRIVNRPVTGYFFYQASVGLLTYKDIVQISYKKQTVKGYTAGLLVSAGYTVLLNKNIGLSIGFNYVSGSLTEYTVTKDGKTTTQRLPEDQAEGLQHFDFKLGLDFIF